MFNHKILIRLLVVGLMLSFVMSIAAQDDERVKLTQDFTFNLATGEMVIFSYPEGWVIESIPVFSDEEYISFAAFLTNDIELPLSLDSEIDSGDIMVNLFPFPYAIPQTILATNDLFELTNAYQLSNFNSEEFDMEFAELGNREIVVGDYTNEFDHRRYGLLLDNIFIFAEFTTPVGELSQHTALMNEIINSVDVATMQN